MKAIIKTLIAGPRLCVMKIQLSSSGRITFRLVFVELLMKVPLLRGVNEGSCEVRLTNTGKKQFL